MDVAEERDLIRRCLAGEVECFAGIVKRYETMVRTLVARLVKDEAVEEELAHEVFIQAYEKLDRFKGNSKFSTWIGQIALNKARDHLRKMKTRRVRQTACLEDTQLASLDPGPFRTISARQECDLLQLALAALKARERRLIVLRHVEEFDYVTIAAMLHSTPNAVKVGSFRATARLREELARLGVRQ